jgi:hypothetical protein
LSTRRTGPITGSVNAVGNPACLVEASAATNRGQHTHPDTPNYRQRYELS